MGMSEKAGMVQAAEESDAGELRGKLLGRLAVAGGLVTLLLGTLVLFDYLAGGEEVEPPVYTQPVPVAPKKQVSQPVTPTDQLPEPPAAEPPVSGKEPTAKSAPGTEAKAESAPVRTPETLPAATASERATVASRSERAGPNAAPVPASPAATRPRPELVPEATRAPANLMPELAPVVRIESGKGMLASRKNDSEPTRLQPLAPAQGGQVAQGAQRLLSGFLLQAGVFTSMQRAEELHSRLLQSGVPSTLETRVQVGPFRTRQEAEAAQAKLRELGISATLVPPPAARH